jgi:general secretion pathway protein H
MGRGVEVVSRRPGHRGFTLLELIVVLFVIALAAGLAAPAIGRSTDALRVRAEVASFSSLLRHAREQAITTRRPHRVVVEPAQHEVRVLVGDEVKRTRAIPARWTIDSPDAPGLVVVRFDPQGTSTGGDYRIVVDRAVWRVTVDAFTGRVKTAREDRDAR